MTNFLIRVRIPDRPGALGAVASRIGAVGADVVSIDILQRAHGEVVDELGVVTATDDLAGLLEEEILEVDGVSLEEVRSIGGPVPDRHAELIEIATALVHQTTPDDVLSELVVRTRSSLAAAFVALVDPDAGTVVVADGDRPPVEQISSSLSRPDHNDRTLTTRLNGSGLVLLVVRKAPILRDRERQRVGALAALADHRWRELHDRSVLA